jgi:hypothetical protein
MYYKHYIEMRECDNTGDQWHVLSSIINSYTYVYRYSIKYLLNKILQNTQQGSWKMKRPSTDQGVT